LAFPKMRFTQHHSVTSNRGKSFSWAPTAYGKRVTLKVSYSAKKDCSRSYTPIPENPPGRLCCLSWMQWKSFAAGKSRKMISPQTCSRLSFGAARLISLISSLKKGVVPDQPAAPVKHLTGSKHSRHGQIL